MHSHWNTRGNQSPTNLSFALVIEEVAGFRDSVMALRREHGWLVHGISRAEEAFNILAYIPSDLIVLDAELPGTGGIDFVRFVRNSNKSRPTLVVVISGSNSLALESQMAECEASLARRSSWENDLFLLLAAESEDAARNCSRHPFSIRS
jgi:CheY-like chemotaxis protein